MRDVLKVYINLRRAVRRWILRKLQPCSQLVPLMSESMDRRLSVFEYFELRLHLLVCTWCARYLKQIKLLRCVLNSAPIMDDSPSESSLSSEARQRIAKALNS